MNLTNPHVLIDIEKKLAKDLKKEMEDAVVRAQKNKSDIFGFGEIMHESHPKEWKKIEKDWDDVSFPKLEVDVQVETFIRRTGLRNKPYLSNLQKRSIMERKWHLRGKGKNQRLPAVRPYFPV